MWRLSREEERSGAQALRNSKLHREHVCVRKKCAFAANQIHKKYTRRLGVHKYAAAEDDKQRTLRTFDPSYALIEQNAQRASCTNSAVTQRQLKIVAKLNHLLRQRLCREDNYISFSIQLVIAHCLLSIRVNVHGANQAAQNNCASSPRWHRCR